MNSSWKAFRALSAASWMGMSLWRMYSAREQDQPPSVLLVGTFYKKQQETGRAVTGAPAQAGSMCALPSHPHLPWRTHPASRSNTASDHSSHGPSQARVLGTHKPRQATRPPLPTPPTPALPQEEGLVNTV